MIEEQIYSHCQRFPHFSQKLFKKKEKGAYRQQGKKISTNFKKILIETNSKFNLFISNFALSSKCK